MQPCHAEAAAEDSLHAPARRTLLAAGVLLAWSTVEQLGLNVAQAVQNDIGILPGIGRQPEWRFCHKCFGMFYNGDAQGRKGHCPAGKGHEAQGFKFFLHHDHTRRQPVAGRDSQFEWRFCHKCFGLFWAGSGDSLGRCPVVTRDREFSDDRHAPHGFIFGLPHDHPGNPGQPDWRFCHKCFGLFFDDPRNANKGRCPAGGGGHVRANNSFNFQIAFTDEWIGARPGVPAPARPTIAARLDAGQALRLTGSGFTPNAAVTVRVVNEQLQQALVVTIGNVPIRADGTGRIAYSLFGLCQTSRRLAVSATDGRQVPPSVDLTGNLWSNTVTLSCG